MGDIGRMPTIGLCVITKELTDELVMKLQGIVQHVDKVYVQENGGASPKFPAFLHRFNYKWNDDFAAARNALIAKVRTDYWLWMDSDDVLEHPENIRQVVEHMAANDIDIEFADYIYQRNEQNIPTEVQRRERIFKTGTPGEWQGMIHETFIPKGHPTTENTELVRWIHVKTKEQEAESTKRNERMLRKAWGQTQDLRYAYYLALNQASQGKLQPAISLFRTLIEKGGWDEERYRAYLQIASCYQQLKDYKSAAAEYLNATTELPSWPDAYYGLQQVYYEVDDHKKSIEWFEIASARTRPDTDSAFNPVVLEYQPLLIAALSYLFIGQIKNAVRAAGKLKKLAPNYSELAKLEPEVIRAYNEEQTIETSQQLIALLAHYDDAQAAKILEALPPTLKADVRLTEQRRTLIPGGKWSKGSIVYYCGPGYEPWGPEYLDGGMGGSEEAVVYLARELNIEGEREVTVYNERQVEYFDFPPDGRIGEEEYGPHYRPWTEINPNDEFDIFIAWRDPSFLQRITARVKICDVHDALSPEVIYGNQEWVDYYMFKSRYHRGLYPELPDEKCRVVSNGILREQFK